MQARISAKAFQGLIKEVAAKLDETAFDSERYNQTGSKVVLRFRVPGHRALLKLKCDTAHLLDYAQKQWVKDIVHARLWSGAKDLLFPEDRMPAGSTSYGEELLDATPAFRETLERTVANLCKGQRVREVFRRHQADLALKEAQTSIRSALNRGASREDMIQLIDEEIVRSVQER